MAESPAQAKAGNSLIYVPTTAARGQIKTGLADNGDMWIAAPQHGKTMVGSIESFEVSGRSYQRLLAVGE